MTAFNLLSAQHPVKEVCDYLHIYPAWNYRMENVRSEGNNILSLDLVKSEKGVSKTIHVHNIDGIGLCIADVSENLTEFRSEKAA